ncbi:MAG: pyridoxal-phosphate dependent enzyme [Thermomicrobiales bacterium]
MIDLERIRAAAAQVTPHVRRTPVVAAPAGLYLKLECLQVTGAYKVRGFFAAALALPPERRARGLLTVRSGNAALACAYVAHELDVPCRTVMLDTAPAPKVEGVRRLGATPVLLPRQQLLDWMANAAWEHEPETFIHPFRDEQVIAGHGSLGLELVEQAPDLARVIVPVGGGGLAVGVASAVKALRPNIEVIGVQATGYPLWPRALAAGGPIALTPATIADGVTAPYDPAMAARRRAPIDRWVLVPEARRRAAIADLAISDKIVAEGAGALAFAAREQLAPGPTTVAIISGGNIAPRLLAAVLTE